MYQQAYAMKYYSLVVLFSLTILLCKCSLVKDRFPSNNIPPGSYNFVIGSYTVSPNLKMIELVSYNIKYTGKWVIKSTILGKNGLGKTLFPRNKVRKF